MLSRTHAVTPVKRPFAPAVVALLCGLLVTTGVLALVPNPATDLNRDGVVNTADRVIGNNCIRAQSLGQPLPAQCPTPDPAPPGGGDGRWDASDAAEIKANLRQTFVVVDTTAPVVGITSPTPGEVFDASPITLSGTVDDGSASINVAVTNAGGTTNVAGRNNGGGTWDIYNVPLAAGSNSLLVTATDRANNSATATVEVRLGALDTVAPVLSILSPPEGAVLTATPTTVTGTVSDDTGIATVTVNGVAATVTNGNFSASVPLDPGANTLTAVATDTSDNSATVTRQVTYTPPDTTPPTVSVDSPSEGAVVTGSPVTVSGTVSDDTGVASVTVNGVTATIDGAGFTVQVPVSAGGNTLTVVARDTSDNSTTVTRQITYTPPDTTPPSVSVDSPTNGAIVNASPVTVVGTVDDDRGVASVTVNGVAATIIGTSFTAQVPVSEGANTLTALATDTSNNVASAGVTITYEPPTGDDTTAPQVAILTPADNAVLATDKVTVTGTVTDDRDVASVSVNGISATLGAGTFTLIDLPLTPGANTITAVATDTSGNPANASVTVTYVLPPQVTISSPSDGALINEDSIEVTGSVDDPAATVTVNGIAATLNSGQFSATLPLTEGFNPITATATNAAGATGSARIQVRRDLTPPTVTFEVPRDGAVLTSLQVDVAGLVNDQSTNITIDSEDVTVTVNGVPAMVSQRAWVIPDMLLQRGPNTLEVVAEDNAGNRSATSVQVNVQDQAGQRIVLLAGNAQSGQIGTQLPEPLVVTLLDAAGDPVPGKPVLFQVSRGDGVINGTDGDVTELTLLTDDNGLASVFFTLGSRGGAGNHRVLATASGFVGEVEYCFAATPAPPRRIAAVTGDQQVGIVGQTLDQPLKVLVNDAGGNPAAGVEVDFVVSEGGGNIEGNPSVTRVTDNDGFASVPFTLGEQEGLSNHVVTASFDGLSEPPAVFIASARTPAPQTSFVGVVIDNQTAPIAGVTVRLSRDGEAQDPALVGITDEQGRFAFANVPAGPAKLIVDGSTAARPGNWIRLTFALEVIAGIENSVGMPIYLLPIGPNATVVQNGGPDEDLKLTMPDIPGAEVTVKAHSVTCPTGLSECVVSWTQINAERMAMPPPMGSMVMLGWTLQPTGARFSPSVDICIPNMDMPPGLQVEMFNWDYGLGYWATVGTATVTEDGAQLCSDPGFGIPSAGWGCCVPPPPPNDCVLSCNDRNECTADSKLDPPCTCKFTPSNNGAQCGGQPGANACKQGTCQNGACVGQNKPDGSSCDDGKYCTRPDKCTGGACAGEAVPDQPGPTTSFELAALNNVLQRLQEFLNLMQIKGVNIPEFQGQLSFDENRVCCEEKQGQMTLEEGGGGTLKVEPWTSPRFVPTVPPWSGDYTVTIFGRSIGVRYGVFIEATVEVAAQLKRTKRECQDDKCWSGTIGPKAGARAGIFGEVPNPALPPQCGPSKTDPCAILRLEGAGSSGVNAQLSVGCDKVSGQIGHNGLVIDGKFIVGEGSIFEVKVTKEFVLVPAGPIGPLSFSLPL